MTPTPISYASPDTPRLRRRWPWRALFVVGGAWFALALAQVATTRNVESRMDAVTGSIAWRTTWHLGIVTGQRVDRSPLEKRLTQSGIAWTPAWQFLHDSERSCFGRGAIGCGSAPAIYQITTLLGEFADASTDAELTEFVRVMQTGTDAQKKAAVEAAGEKGLSAMAGG